MKQETARTVTFRELPNRSTKRNGNEQTQPSLKDIVAQNQARRRTHIMKPRHEVEEEQIADLPICNKTFIKDDFIIYK